MGYFEGWDNCWSNSSYVLGWICPRCEQFIPMYEEHTCGVVESEKKIQMDLHADEEVKIPNI